MYIEQLKKVVQIDTVDFLVLKELSQFINNELPSFDIQKLSSLTDENFVIAMAALNESLLLKREKRITNLVFEYEDDKFCNQKTFSDMCKKDGLDTFGSSYIGVYYKRGSLPAADLIIEEKPYWRKSTIQNFIKNKKGE